MTGLALMLYANLLRRYDKKWENDRLNRDIQDVEYGEEMRKDYGYEGKNFQRIPKRKFRNYKARKHYMKKNLS